MIKHKLTFAIGAFCLAASSLCFAADASNAPAPAPANLGQAASNLTNVVSSFSQLALAIAFICGLGFAISSIMKFKKHKDNPQQMPLSTPVTELFLAMALLFIPALSKIAGISVFGIGAQQATGTGEVVTVHPQPTYTVPAPAQPSYPQPVAPQDPTKQYTDETTTNPPY